MPSLRSACLALLIFACSASGQVSPSAGRFALLDAALDANARELLLPGISAALIERGRLVWTGTRGWADIEAHRPVTPATPFNIASLTKPMSAVMLMQLVERGRLSLDTPMLRYDPSFTDPRITVGHVLSMSSESDPPGQAFNYDGNIYGQLGSVLAAVTGETLAQSFSARLIAPLGLTRTSPGAVATDERGMSGERIAHYRAINARLATPYNIYGGVEPVPALPPDPEPNAAANVVGTASDYARFADAVLHDRLLGRATRERMWTAAVNARGERLPYAYGWFAEDYRGHRLIWHYGLYDNAYSAIALIVPERELVFVALANGSGLSGHSGIDPIEGNAMACAVLVAFVDPALPCAGLAAANVARWRARIRPPLPEIASDPATLPRYVGVYRRPNGAEANVLVDQGGLWWQSSAGRHRLAQVGPDRFVMKADNRIMLFLFDEGGRVTRIDVTFPGDPNTYAVPRLR
jgi:CubicO group peptidase (beta-lactamase class C family)